MDFQDFEKQWADHIKLVRKDAPVDKDIVSEIAGIQGALAKLRIVGGELEKTSESLHKALVSSIAAAELAAKEVAGFVVLAKKADKNPPLSGVTDKELETFIKAAKPLKDALAKFNG